MRSFLKKKSIKFKPYNKRLSLKRFTTQNKNFKLRYRIKIKPFIRKNKPKRKSFLLKVKKVQKISRFQLQPKITQTRKNSSVFNKKTFRIFNRQRKRRVRRSFVSTIRSITNFRNRSATLKNAHSPFVLGTFRKHMFNRFHINLKTITPSLLTRELFYIRKYKKLLLNTKLHKMKKSNTKHVIKFNLNRDTRTLLLKKNVKARKLYKRFKPVRLNKLSIQYVFNRHHHARLGHSWTYKTSFFNITESSNQLLVTSLSYLLVLNRIDNQNSTILDSISQDFNKYLYFSFEFSSFFSSYSAFTSVTTSLKQRFWQNRTLLLNTLTEINMKSMINSQPSQFEYAVTEACSVLAQFKKYKTNYRFQLFTKLKNYKLVKSSHSFTNLYMYLQNYNVKSINYNNKALYFYNRSLSSNNKTYLKKHLNLFLINLQMTGYRDSSAFVNRIGRHKKPNIFTYRTTLKEYMFTYTMIAQRSSPHFFWNGTCLSRSMEFQNGLLSNAFLLTFNEDFWENSIYVKPKTDLDSFTNHSSNVNTILRKVLTTSVWSSGHTNSSKKFIKSLSRTRLNRKSFPQRYLQLRRFKVKKFVNKLPFKIFPLFDKLQNAKSFNNKRISAKVKRFLSKKKFYRKSRKFLLIKKRSKSRRVVVRRILRKIRPIYYLKLRFSRKLINSKLSSAKRNLISKLYFLTKNRRLVEARLKIFKKHIKSTKGVLITKVEALKNALIRFQKWDSSQKSKTFKLRKQNRFLSRILRKRILIKKHLNKLRLGKWTHNLNPLSAIVKTYILKRRRRGYRSLKWRKKKLKSHLFNRKKKLKTLLIKSENVGNFTSFQAIGEDDSPTNWASTLNTINRNLINDTAKVHAANNLAPNLKFSEQSVNRGVFTSKYTLNFDFEQVLFNLFFLNTLIKNPVMLKYILYKVTTQLHKASYDITLTTIKPILLNLEKFYFGSRWDYLKSSNLYPLPSFNYSIQRRLISLFTFRRFSTYTSIWYLNMLVRFVEFCTGRKVYIKLNPFIEKSLLLTDQIQCRMWETRVAGFQRILGPKLFLKESLRILMVALKYKDPTFLINWIKAMLYRMSFWKYRSLFRNIKFVLKNLFEPNFATLGLRGFKIKLKGKISVAGNARTRTLLFKVGRTSHSKFNNKVAHSFTLINSFTGVMGFNLWIFF